jgi:formamidopyrimidine-DNA glycosylase
MPELPEVETTRRGLAPHLQGRRVHGVILRRADLRWPIPPEVAELLPGQRIEDIRRRAKYLLLDTAGSAVLHLGMSGSLRVLPGDTPLRAHDHVDISLDNGRLLRFNDPRRFGSLLWQPPVRSTRCCRGWARSHWTMPSTATTCSPAAVAAARR